MEPPWKAEMERLAVQLLSQDYKVATYGQTLNTTYYDSLNPKYAEQKKDTNIGKKYFVQLMRKVGDREVNLLTLEFNGIEKQMYIYAELSFYEAYHLVRTELLNSMMDELDAEVRIFIRRDSFTREEIERSSLEATLESMLKPRMRPYIYLVIAVPLEGTYTESEIIDRLKWIWEETAAFRDYVMKLWARGAKARTFWIFLTLSKRLTRPVFSESRTRLCTVLKAKN
ncbi:MAG: hypothetical protein KID09_24810 [Paenibacillus macerans]|uniref:hypothetical protein n=1 Tax=Paenibacillus macerans TaxID=44252 RepID=UPI002430BA78|nr:hypothetical protein [Paenibacillus macerans]MBS5913804.1 hypothetical protein [Paenibacillus macerans]MDU5947351.1 hypothetical protein [Paenibacillus macerans]